MQFIYCFKELFQVLKKIGYCLKNLDYIIFRFRIDKSVLDKNNEFDYKQMKKKIA